MAETWGNVGPRGSEVFSDDETGDIEWARCHWRDCPNFVCRRLSQIHCWLHADGQPSGAEYLKELTCQTAEVVP